MGVKVYVLTDGQYEESVEGVFSTPEAAMAARPDIRWEKAVEEDFPGGFWHGANGLRFSRIWGFEIDG